MFRRLPCLLSAFFAFTFLVALVPAAFAAETPPAVANQSSVEISVSDLKALMQSAVPVVIVDVRQPSEHAAGHIEGSILMPLDNLKTTFQTLPIDKPIIAYCRSGKRSTTAVSYLKEQGYTDVRSLTGGYPAWAAADQPLN